MDTILFYDFVGELVLNEPWDGSSFLPKKSFMNSTTKNLHRRCTIMQNRLEKKSLREKSAEKKENSSFFCLQKIPVILDRFFLGPYGRQINN